MTKRQHQILSFIRGFIDEHGYSPTLRQVSAGVDTALSNVSRLVAALTRDGHLTRSPNGKIKAMCDHKAASDLSFECLVQELGRRGWFVVNKDELTIAQLATHNPRHVKTGE